MTADSTQNTGFRRNTQALLNLAGYIFDSLALLYPSPVPVLHYL